VHGRPEHEIGLALPGLQLLLLCGADGAADYLKDVGRSATLSVMEAYGNSNDKFGAEFASCASRHGGDQAAICKAARANLNGLKNTRERATRSDRFREVALAEDDGVARSQVRGNDGQGQLEILKLSCAKQFLHQSAQPFIAGQAKARHTPLGKIAKTNLAAFLNDAGKRYAAGIGRSKDAPDAASGEGGNRNAVLLEGLQDAEMCVAAGEPAAEREADPYTRGSRLCIPSHKMAELSHDDKDAGNPRDARWTRRPEMAVPKYLSQKYGEKGPAAAGSTKILVG